MGPRLEDFEVLGTIGSGAHGTVRKVRRRQDRQVLVWKELNYAAMTEAEKQGLVLEVNLLRELRHPNIVRFVHHIVERQASTLYILMEYCPGGDLKRLISRCKQTSTFLEEGFIWRVLKQICEALKVCHDRRQHAGRLVLHRDIKPANVFLDATGMVKLGDFGLARTLSSEASFATTFVGTPYYMSPEVMQGQEYNEMSDIWSLGCLVYELCALHPPFQATSHKQLAAKIKEARYDGIPIQYSSELRNILGIILTYEDYLRPTALMLLHNSSLVANTSGVTAEEGRGGGPRRGSWENDVMRRLSQESEGETDPEREGNQKGERDTEDEKKCKRGRYREDKGFLDGEIVQEQVRDLIGERDMGDQIEGQDETDREVASDQEGDRDCEEEDREIYVEDNVRQRECKERVRERRHISRSRETMGENYLVGEEDIRERRCSRDAENETEERRAIALDESVEHDMESWSDEEIAELERAHRIALGRDYTDRHETDGLVRDQTITLERVYIDRKGDGESEEEGERRRAHTIKDDSKNVSEAEIGDEEIEDELLSDWEGDKDSDSLTKDQGHADRMIQEVIQRGRTIANENLNYIISPPTETYRIPKREEREPSRERRLDSPERHRLPKTSSDTKWSARCDNEKNWSAKCEIETKQSIKHESETKRSDIREPRDKRREGYRKSSEACLGETVERICQGMKVYEPPATVRLECVCGGMSNSAWRERLLALREAEVAVREREVAVKEREREAREREHRVAAMEREAKQHLVRAQIYLRQSRPRHNTDTSPQRPASDLDTTVSADPGDMRVRTTARPDPKKINNPFLEIQGVQPQPEKRVSFRDKPVKFKSNTLDNPKSRWKRGNIFGLVDRMAEGKKDVKISDEAKDKTSNKTGNSQASATDHSQPPNLPNHKKTISQDLADQLRKRPGSVDNLFRRKDSVDDKENQVEETRDKNSLNLKPPICSERPRINRRLGSVENLRRRESDKENQELGARRKNVPDLKPSIWGRQVGVKGPRQSANKQLAVKPRARVLQFYNVV